jgi:predicted lipid-binding transport protein (Tim44 family)
MQQQTPESARRERLFGEFITQASALYADALTHDLLDPSKLASLYAVKAQLSLFGSQPSIDRAEEALQLIVDTYYQPNADFNSREALRTQRRDFLREFTQASRRDLLV